MERLTIDTKILFCDIAQCRETPGGSFCEGGYCDQRRVYERLREYERLGDIDELTALVKAREDDTVVLYTVHNTISAKNFLNEGWHIYRRKPKEE